MKEPPEKPLWIDMDFGEALHRFIQTDPKELPDSARLAGKAARKKGGKSANRPTTQPARVEKPPKGEVEPLD